jgi:hypothetical protein
MPTFKTTLLFQLATGTEAPNPSLRRIGGWSESFYAGGANFDAAIGLLFGTRGAPVGLCEARAGLLPRSAQIVGQRIQQVNPVGRSQSLNRIFNGGSGMDCDVPQMALLTRIPSAVDNHIRPYIIRGIPDQLVVDGEYRPTDDFKRAVTLLMQVLSSFALRSVVPADLPNTIESISPAGLVTFSVVRPPLVAGYSIEIKGVQLVGGVIGGGTFTIESVSTTYPVQRSIRGWTQGAGVGGAANGTGIIYPVLDGANATIGRIIVRKVGRPFVGYRGRASVRRKRRRVA